MVSFLNGKSPFDEAEEKLEAGETVNGRPKMSTGPVMGWQDGVFLLVVIGLIVGGYQYYQYAKKKSAETFATCNSMYELAVAGEAAKYLEAETCYEGTWDLGFVSDSMEILRQDRLGAITDMRSVQKDLLQDAKDALEDGDTAKATTVVKEYTGAMFLTRDDKKQWESIATLAK